MGGTVRFTYMHIVNLKGFSSRLRNVPPAKVKKKGHPKGGLSFLVDLKGFEPSTSRMRTERSPS